MPWKNVALVEVPFIHRFCGIAPMGQHGNRGAEAKRSIHSLFPEAPLFLPRSDNEDTHSPPGSVDDDRKGRFSARQGLAVLGFPGDRKSKFVHQLLSTALKPHHPGVNMIRTHLGNTLTTGEADQGRVDGASYLFETPRNPYRQP